MKSIMLVILLFVFVACSTGPRKKAQNAEGDVPARVLGLDGNAFWRQKDSIGYWFVVEDVNGHSNAATISLYDKEGSFILSKKFILICTFIDTARPQLIRNLSKQIKHYDGSIIQLEDSCYMQPL